MTSAHLLVDIASYAARVLKPDVHVDGGSGDCDVASKCEAEVRKFVANFRSEHSKKLKSDGLLLLMLNRVNLIEKRGWLKTLHRRIYEFYPNFLFPVSPHTVRTEPRLWKPVSMTSSSRGDSDRESLKVDKLLYRHVDAATTRLKMATQDDDDVLNDDDFRYYMVGCEQTQDMETAVEENPSDVSMWIKLAYKKLRDGHSCVLYMYLQFAFCLDALCSIRTRITSP